MRAQRHKNVSPYMYGANSKGKSILRSTLMLEWQHQERPSDETEHANLEHS